ncbi:MAG TPA: amidohydrolase family protein [Burkholderiales bacterium]|nr:amidohydrolase family protein [Burkholderiales bacterium]
MRAAWQGIDPAKVWDAHAHLVGTGDSGGGIIVNPAMASFLDPGQYARRLFFLNAGCAHDAPGSVDRAYIERMHNLLAGMPGTKLLLFAFDRTYAEDGRPELEHTAFHVPDAYARDTARAHPQLFEWVASVHPYAPDALERLEQAKRDGARAVKWLPAAMGIDPGSSRCQKFYETLRKLDLPLISHAGEERAVLGRDAHDYGNPLRLRRPLETGVRVVIAHCASMGSDRDLDKGANGPYVQSFSLFARIFERYETHAFGDLSAITQANRAGPALARIIDESSWHTRLLNGSDYPLPGVMPLFSVGYLVSLRLLEERWAPVLTEIRRHNPLLFDFVLKRTVRSNGKALATGVFETREFFMRSSRHVGQ